MFFWKIRNQGKDNVIIKRRHKKWKASKFGRGAFHLAFLSSFDILSPSISISNSRLESKPKKQKPKNKSIGGIK